MKNSLFVYLAIMLIISSKIIGQNIVDYDGNSYYTITIGTQTWMKENLRVTHFRNGEKIQNIISNSDWLNQKTIKTAAYCDYNNNPANSKEYGRLYNWYAVDDTREICPKGWHVPSSEEILVLINYFGGNELAAEKLIQLGFHNQPGVGRSYFREGDFINIGLSWWTSSMVNELSAYQWGFSKDKTTLDSGSSWPMYSGFCIRCLKD